jgi:hypothetical protein
MIKKIILFLVILFSFSTNAHAASLFLDSPTDIKKDQIFEANIKLDSMGEVVNSFSISLAYPVELLTFNGYKEDSTVIKMFIEKPKVVNGKISFSGIIPGGISGFYDPDKKDVNTLPVITLLFKPRNAGEGVFSFTDVQILKNDGLGTSLSTQSSDKNIKVNSVEESIKEEKDSIKPLPFNIQLIEASSLSNTPLMLYFNTRDLDSGIKNYQIKINNTVWMNAESPYVISRGFFAKNFTVRAFDHAGNYEEANIRLDGESIYILILITLVLIVFVLCLFYLLIWKNAKFNQKS